MTHDWFSHMDEGQNGPGYEEVGCSTDQAAALGCRPGDRVDKPLVSQDSTPEQFTSGGKEYLSRAPKTFANNNTAWWDASQLYGYDETSRKRVRRDPADPARLLLEPVSGMTGQGYLPVFLPTDPVQPQWAGQEASGFPDNWTIGMSFYHNLLPASTIPLSTNFESRRRRNRRRTAVCAILQPRRASSGIRTSLPTNSSKPPAW